MKAGVRASKLTNNNLQDSHQWIEKTTFRRQLLFGRQTLAVLDILIVGQGLAGSCLAWSLHWAGRQVMIVDRGDQITASRVAAGLITPLTGRRIVRTPRYKESYRQAAESYRRIERELNVQLLIEKSAIRKCVTDEESRLFEQRFAEFDGGIKLHHDERGKLVGIEMQNAARLNVCRFLDQTREYFSSLGQYRSADLNVDTDIDIVEDRVCVASLDIQSSAVVFCQGWQLNANSWFPAIPDGPAKGEIFRVKLPGYTEDKVVHQGVWVVPDQFEDQPDSFLVGATYDRHHLNQEPTVSGQQELLNGLRHITSAIPEVIDHVAAVRAGMKRRKPILGQHPENEKLFVLNGLGSRGALLAPIAAEAMKGIMFGEPVSKDLREVIDILPGKPQATDLPLTAASQASQRPKSVTQLAHNVIRRIVKPGDTVIDATAGNGNDTQLLASLVEASGRTIAMDIQRTAIESTSSRLERVGLIAELRLVDHAVELDLLNSAGTRVKAVMFNLGYLPGSDKLIATGASSTLAAIQVASRMLLPGGAITIVAYRGHGGGLEEATTVEQWMSELSADQFETSRIDGDVNNATSPVLFVVRKS